MHLLEPGRPQQFAPSYTGTNGEGCHAVPVPGSVQASEVCERPQLFQRVPCTVPCRGGLHRGTLVRADDAIELSRLVIGQTHELVLVRRALHANRQFRHFRPPLGGRKTCILRIAKCEDDERTWSVYAYSM